MRLYFRLYGKLNSFEIPVNRGSSSTNSCDDKLTSAVVVPHIYLNFVPETITEEIHREASKPLNKKDRIPAGPDASNIRIQEKRYNASPGRVWHPRKWASSNMPQ